MATPFDQEFNPEFMGLLAQAGPVPDVMPNPMPAMAPSAGLLAQAPVAVTAPSAPTVSPEMQMLERLLSGGSIGKGMSLGDKLTTLGAVLSSAAYGGNPAEVMQNARARRIADIQSRMQLAQMRTQMANREALLASLPEDERKLVAWLSTDDLSKYVLERQKGPEATSFQRDYEFVKRTFGSDAAAEFAQYGRSGNVSIPLGEGRGTYVGPASQAPGASRWREQPGVGAPTAPAGVADSLRTAASSNRITQREADVILQSLGPNGQKKFNSWLQNNKIKVVVRTGTDANNRRVEQYSDGTYGYAD